MVAAYARACVLLASFLLLSCASRTASPPALAIPAGGTDAIRSEPVPQGVDPQLWQKLTAELARVVEQQGSRGASSVAQGRGSEVRDLLYIPSQISERLHWTYRCQGDYDLNGEVNISDLTPIAVHYMKRTTDPTWQVNQLADGDGNGEVNISDVTPLGSNLGARVLGYVVQEQATGVGEEFEFYGFVPYSGGQPNTGIYPDFFFNLSNPLPLHKFRVVPAETAMAPYPTGVPSDEVAVTGEVFHQPWEQRGGNSFRNGLSELNGPAFVGSTWTVDLQGVCYDSSGPVADRDGVVYCTSFTFPADNQGTLDGSTGSVWAVGRDGTVRWRFQSDDGIVMQPVLLADGTVVVQTYRNELLGLYPDGKLHWKQQMTSDNTLSLRHITVAPSGAFYALDSAPSLRRLLPDGSVSWAAPVTLAGSPIAPVIANELIVMPSGTSELSAYQLAGGSFDSSVMLNANYQHGMMLEPSNSLLWTSQQSGQDLQGVPLDIGNQVNYTSLVGSATTAPALNSVGHVVLGESVPSANPEEPNTGRLVGVNDLGAESWDRPLAAVPFGGLACDASERVFVGATGNQDDTGFYGIDEQHNIAWFVHTGGVCLGIAVAGEGYCAGIFSSELDFLGPAQLIGIDEQ
jgi:hypothetical protein